MLTKKQQAASLAALAFFCIAMLCAESSRLAACDTVSIHAGATKNAHSPVAGQRKALKRSIYAEVGAAPDSARLPARYLSPQERRSDFDLGSFRLLPATAGPAQKVSTNLFLSVLNL